MMYCIPIYKLLQKYSCSVQWCGICVQHERVRSQPYFAKRFRRVVHFFVGLKVLGDENRQASSTLVPCFSYRMRLSVPLGVEK